jgi:formate dehydrogenase
MSDRTASFAPSRADSAKKKGRGKVRGTPKGRRVDPKALQEVQALLGNASRRRDLLIEHLHKIQDRYRHISAAHLAALASEMKMAMAEVYEVATFYHHFDVVKEGETAPPAITVRVCDSIACDLAGSHHLLEKLPALLGTDVRVLHAPCVGRCETAPVVVVGQNPIPSATAEQVVAEVKAGRVTHPASGAVTPGHVGYAAYRAQGGYTLAADCVAGKKTRDDVIGVMENSGLRGLGGAGFPAGRKWKLVSAEPAPRLMAINIDEGEPGTFKDRYYLERDPHRLHRGRAHRRVGRRHRRDLHLPPRRVPRLPRHPRAGDRALKADPPFELPSIHLRRGAGAYICGEESSMIESIEGKRGEPRLRPPYVAQVGLFGRRPSSTTWRRCTGCAPSSRTGPSGLPPGPQRPQGAALVLGQRPGEEAGRAPGAGRHHAARADRRVLRRHARRPRAVRLPAWTARPGGILPASKADVPLDFDQAQRIRLLHRLGGDRGVLEPRHPRRHRAQLMKFFPADESAASARPAAVGHRESARI